MNKSNIFLSYGNQESPESILKLSKALNEYRTLQEELNQVTKETKTLRQWLNDFVCAAGTDALSALNTHAPKFAPALHGIYPQDPLRTSKPSNWNGFENIPFYGNLPSEANSIQTAVYNYLPVFDKNLTDPCLTSSYLTSEEPDFQPRGLDFPTQVTSCTDYVYAGETCCETIFNDSINWQEFHCGYFLYIESSRKEKKLRRRRKKAKREIRELTGVKRLLVNVYNSPIGVFQRLQSIRINDKSGDEFNNLDKYKISRLLIFKN